VLAVSTGDYCLSSVLAHTGSQTHIVNKHSNYMNARSRDGVVGIVTRHGLEGPVTKSRWGRYFPHQSRRALSPTQPPAQLVPSLARR
jgi:hypothetical protein